MCKPPYPKFLLALQSLGDSDPERARALCVSTKSISRYRDGKLPPQIKTLMLRPDLLRALADDADFRAGTGK